MAYKLDFSNSNMFGAKKKKNKNEQGLVASAAGGNQGPAPAGVQQSKSSYDDMMNRYNEATAGAQSQLDSAMQQQQSQMEQDASKFQAMSGDNPFGNENPITGNLDTSMHGVGGTAINTGANAGITVDTVDDQDRPGGITVTGAEGHTLADPWSGSQTAESQRLANMYYRDEFIDPLIKDNILQREAADFTGDTATHTASQVNMLDPSVTADSAGRMAQLSQLDLLKSMAGGEMSPVIQQQRDRGIQDTLAMMASQRGAPTSAVMRTGMEGMSEVNRQAMEAAAQQQLQATQLLGEAAGQVRGQDFDIANAQAQYQQQAGLTNAQMQNEMIQAEQQINTQLEQNRDNMLNALIATGVDRDVALMQVNAEIMRLKEELTYKYWAGKFGGEVQTLGQLIEATDTGAEDVFENILEEGSVFNIIGGRQTPGGYNVGTTQITGPLGYQGGLSDPTEPVGPDDDDWTLIENQPGAAYGTGSAPGGGGGGGGGGTQGGMYRDPITGQWVYSDERAKFNVNPVGTDVGTRDEFFQPRKAQRFGQMFNASPELANRVAANDPMAVQNIMKGSLAGRKKLGDVKRGLVRGRQQDITNAINQTAPGPSASDAFKSGVSDVGNWIQAGALGQAGAGLFSGDKEERKASAHVLGRAAAQKGLEAGVEEIGKYFSDAEKTADATAAGAEEALKETGTIAGESTAETLDDIGAQVAEDTSSITAAQAAPYIGGALQFISSTLQGDQIGPSAIQATGGTLGGLAGAGMAAAVGEALAAGAASAAMGGATSGAAAGSVVPGIGTAIGGLIGAGAGAIGATAGGLASAPLAEAARRVEQAPATMRPLRDLESQVGAPALPGTFEGAPGLAYSGMTTKQNIMQTGSGANIAPVSTPFVSGIAGAPPRPGTSMFGRSSAIGSDKGIKNNVGESPDEISDFLRNLDPVKFDYKPEFGGEKNQYGIIAQDAEKTPVGDSFVEQDANGHRMIDTNKATMVNMAALANQQKILDRQGKIIAKLLGEL